MIKFKALIGSATAAALLAGAAAPAVARPYWGGGYHHHHRGGGGDTFGKLLLGAVIGGGIFAVANASKDKDRAVASRRGDDQRDDLRDAGADAREVAGICTEAVEGMSRGRVAAVDSVDRDGPDWRVDGVVDVERQGDRRFFCDVRDGRVETVQLGERAATGAIARRGVR